MGANIITGYTGTRHITPAMDAAVYRSTFGPDSYILSDGNQLAGSMPSVNEFTVLDGLVSMQGHQIQVTQETLSVDTCANGYKRIDLVCMRFAHDNNTQVDSASLIVIKGTEVADPNDPSVPAYNTGDIDSGASLVDFPLYRIDLAGSTVTFSYLFTRCFAACEQNVKIEIPSFSSLPLTVTDSRIRARHICKPGDYSLSNISAQTSNWGVSTSNGSLTLSGSISGSTTATLYLTISY